MMYGAFMIMFCCNLLKMDGWFMLKHSEDEWIDFLRRGEKGWIDCAAALRKGPGMDDSPSLPLWTLRTNRTNIFG